MDSLRENHKELIKKLMLKSKQGFTSKKRNVFTEEVIDIIALIATNDE